MPEQLVTFRTQAGQPVTRDGLTITPLSQALVIRLPVVTAGLIWNRPLSVTVESTDAPAQTIPIWDSTRLWQLALLGLGLLGSIIIRRFNHDGRK